MVIDTSVTDISGGVLITAVNVPHNTKEFFIAVTKTNVCIIDAATETKAKCYCCCHLLLPMTAMKGVLLLMPIL